MKGTSVKNRKGNNKIIFANVNAKLRTNKSFKNQTQKAYDKGVSPILEISGFDPVRQLFLDPI